MEKEKSENSGLVQGNAEKKPVWNRPCNGDSGIRPVMGASSWPAILETKKASLSNKSSSDSLKSLGDGSSSVPFSQKNEFLAFTEQMEKSLINRTFASASTNGTVAQPWGQSYPEFLLPYPFSRGQNQRNEFASQSQNRYQRNSYKNQNGNHHPHQSHCNQNWNLHINFNGGGLAHPPPPVPPIHAHYMPLHQSFYPFSGPMVFPDWAPSLMYHPHHMPFIESPPYVFLFQDCSLETRIRNQVHYYFSEENLRDDEFLRKRMNDEGFVHIQFIAGFKKLKTLTGNNIQLILGALQGSDIVELKDYEIRNRYKWRRFLMPPDLRTPFYPSPEYEMSSKVQNLSLEPKADETGASSSNQRADNNNSSANSTLP